jgi:hypothetical protein
MSATMQLRVKGMTLAKNGRRWTEFVIEHETPRGWRVLASFRTTEEVRSCLAERPDDNVEFVTDGNRRILSERRCRGGISHIEDRE